MIAAMNPYLFLMWLILLPTLKNEVTNGNDLQKPKNIRIIYLNIY